MAEAPQIQVTTQPVTITAQGLPGAPLIKLMPVASQTGDVLQVIDPTTGLRVGGISVGGAVGGRQPIIAGNVATRTLLASESGSVCLFDRAAGTIYTLPAPLVGLYFDFITTVTATSNNHTVITDTGTTFMLGYVTMEITAAATTLGATGNGTSHIKIQSNGGTTGGILGSQYRVTCVTATQWNVTGVLSGTATLATPFA